MGELLYESKEESYFADWLTELTKLGFIKSWEKISKPISLTSGLEHTYNQIITLKTKTKVTPKTQVILRASEYTPDFGITWSKYGKDIFYQPINDSKKLVCPILSNEKEFSLIEIKAEWDYKNMTRSFIHNQKFIWDKYKTYVNLIKISDLFSKTFAPASYFKTPTGLDRKFTNGKPLTYHQFHDQI